jgi:hypothetical protein
VYVCMCVGEREGEDVYVCVRERGSICVRESEEVCVCAYM